jgi:hypothetical protein
LFIQLGSALWLDHLETPHCTLKCAIYILIISLCIDLNSPVR